MKWLPILFVSYTATLATISGCAKDYSYEGSPKDTLVLPVDSIATEPPFFSPCVNCTNTAAPALSTWSFKIGPSAVCGEVTKALISIEKTSFTFFGPSACSVDSGFIASVYLTDPLVGNKTNVSSAKVAFYYYDNVTPSYVLVSKSGEPFSLTIDAYDDGTKIATGTFTGAAFTVNGDKKMVTNGKFKIQF